MGLSPCSLMIMILFGFMAAHANASESCAPLVITHPVRAFDRHRVAKPGIEREIRSLEQKGCSDFKYLIGIQEDRAGYLSKSAQQAIDERWISADGTHPFLITGDSVIVAGGYYGQCHYLTIRDLLSNRLTAGIRSDLRIVIPGSATYFTGSPKNLTLTQWLESIHYSPRLIPEGTRFYEIAGRLIRDLEKQASLCVLYRIAGQEFEYGPQSGQRCDLKVTLDFEL